MNNTEELKIYCVTNKKIEFLENSRYILAGVGKDDFPKSYLKPTSKENINFKEKYYSELTFHYWFWKNILPTIGNEWIGFCQKRRFWIKETSINEKISKDNIVSHMVINAEKNWRDYESIITEPIDLTNIKISKLLKRGLKNIIFKPSILFNKKQRNIKLHFDMHHGHGVIDKAIDFLKYEDQIDFKKFIDQNTKFNPHIMFISKKKIIDKWFSDLFDWLFKCEEEFGFKNLKNYETGRLYAYLAERYLSFWFQKYTKYKVHPWRFINV